jgi:hypothetical protein
MNLTHKIEQAFSYRQKPNKLIDSREKLVTPEQMEALWFSDRDWREITWENWEDHRDAIYAFTPEAFAYYLPSILTLSSQCPHQWFWPADALLKILDRSPVVDYWDTFITTRLLGLRVEEYEVLKDWLLVLSEHSNSASENTLDRAFDTICLLQKESTTRDEV